MDRARESGAFPDCLPGTAKARDGSSCGAAAGAFEDLRRAGLLDPSRPEAWEALACARERRFPEGGGVHVDFLRAQAARARGEGGGLAKDLCEGREDAWMARYLPDSSLAALVGGEGECRRRPDILWVALQSLVDGAGDWTSDSTWTLLGPSLGRGGMDGWDLERAVRVVGENAHRIPGSLELLERILDHDGIDVHGLSASALAVVENADKIVGHRELLGRILGRPDLDAQRTLGAVAEAVVENFGKSSVSQGMLEDVLSHDEAHWSAFEAVARAIVENFDAAPVLMESLRGALADSGAGGPPPTEGPRLRRRLARALADPRIRGGVLGAVAGAAVENLGGIPGSRGLLEDVFDHGGTDDATLGAFAEALGDNFDKLPGALAQEWLERIVRDPRADSITLGAVADAVGGNFGKMSGAPGVLELIFAHERVSWPALAFIAKAVMQNADAFLDHQEFLDRVFNHDEANGSVFFIATSWMVLANVDAIPDHQAFLEFVVANPNTDGYTLGVVAGAVGDHFEAMSEPRELLEDVFAHAGTDGSTLEQLGEAVVGNYDKMDDSWGLLAGVLAHGRINGFAFEIIASRIGVDFDHMSDSRKFLERIFILVRDKLRDACVEIDGACERARGEYGHAIGAVAYAVGENAGSIPDHQALLNDLLACDGARPCDWIDGRALGGVAEAVSHHFGDIDAPLALLERVLAHPKADGRALEGMAWAVGQGAHAIPDYREVVRSIVGHPSADGSVLEALRDSFRHSLRLDTATRMRMSEEMARLLRERYPGGASPPSGSGPGP